MEQNSKRIVKNTIYLYSRQLVIMALGFFTTRIVLDKLGASDYGVNNVVAGFVSMFTLLNNVLQTGTRRFLALNLGKGEENLLKLTFSTSFVIHLCVAVIVVILLESFGLWFLNSELNIPEGRMIAANWVFQFSIVSIFLGITQTPYTAAITAHEHFNIYAFLSIFDVLAKLAVLFLLVYIPADKLILYAFLTLFVNFLNISITRWYCIKHFVECKFSLTIDKSLFREMSVFSGWSTIGNLSATLNSHGRSVLLNMFFNTIVNAAVGLAGTVSFTISQFVDGFVTAATPQLVKYYGAGDKERFEKLTFNVSQYSIFLLALIGIPVLLEIDYVLQLWLTEVPQYTSEFIKITVLVSFISYSNRFIDQGIIAIGRAKELALYSQPLYLMTLPLVYLALKTGCTPSEVYFVGAVPISLVFIVNLNILRKFVQFPARKFFLSVFIKNIVLVLLAMIFPYLIQQRMESGLLRFIVVCGVSVLCTVTILYSFALNKETRMMIFAKVKKIACR